MNLVIIGAGQIGSRHLQALGLLEVKVKIQVIDPSQESLKVAQTRFEEVAKEKQNITLEFLSEIEQAEKVIHTAIIATSSAIRRKVTEDLIIHANIKFIIFEKFLFADINDYEWIGNLLNEKKIKAYVNCPRRLFPNYQEIQEQLKGQKNVVFHAIGSNWGLGCNGIHMLDLFYYLTGKGNVVLYNDWIDKEILASKRQNYVEFSGTMRGTNNTNKFLITSHKEGNSPLVISLYNENFRILIEESSGTIFYSSSSSNWKWENKPFKMYYQSQLTHLVIQDLSTTGTCKLTSYEESSYLHQCFLNNLLSFIERTQNIKASQCLIT